MTRKPPTYLTHREADAYLTDYVRSVMGMERVLIARAVTVRAVRRMLGLEAADPESVNLPVIQGGVGLLSFLAVPHGFMVMLHNEDPIEGFPTDYGLILNVCELKMAEPEDPNDWPEYKVGQ